MMLWQLLCMTFEGYSIFGVIGAMLADLNVNTVLFN